MHFGPEVHEAGQGSTRSCFSLVCLDVEFCSPGAGGLSVSGSLGTSAFAADKQVVQTVCSSPILTGLLGASPCELKTSKPWSTKTAQMEAGACAKGLPMSPSLGEELRCSLENFQHGFRVEGTWGPHSADSPWKDSLSYLGDKAI